MREIRLESFLYLVHTVTTVPFEGSTTEGIACGSVIAGRARRILVAGDARATAPFKLPLVALSSHSRSSHQHSRANDVTGDAYDGTFEEVSRGSESTRAKRQYARTFNELSEPRWQPVPPLSDQSKPVTRNGTENGGSVGALSGKRFPHGRLGARVGG